MEILISVISVAAPVVGLIYGVGEHFGWWDRLTGRNAALEAIERLGSVTGYPEGWIFNDQVDARHFRALERRMARKTTQERVSRVLGDGHAPSLIVMGGNPVAIGGVEPTWEQSARLFYSENHPVMMAFGLARPQDGEPDSQHGKICKACTLGELRRWVQAEAEKRRFWVETLMVGLLSIAVALLALRLDGS